MSNSTEGILLGIGNPLLDISAHVKQEFMDQYNIKPNNAILAESQHLPMYEQMINEYQVEYTAGGATQNTIRIAQHFLMTSNSTTYIGCIGNDKFGEQLRNSANADGVTTLYRIDQSEPTGTCAVAIINKERSLVANLGAANKYESSHLQLPQVQAAINKAKYFYSAGFFLTVSPESLMKIAQHVESNHKILGINLAAPFIAQFFTQPLLAALEYADYIFGNESEAEAFGTVQKLDDNTPESVAKYLSQYKSVRSNGHKRVAVITQGSKQTIVAVDGNITTYPVPVLSSDLIVDVNGAGDAFVGGFISQLVQGKSIEQCVHAGHFAARNIIQVSGINLHSMPKTIQ